MDIHPLRQTITSVKDFLRELLTITAGILIALSFEGILGWHHHRQLVRDARVNIVGELQSNRRELITERRDLDSMEIEIRGLLKLVYQVELDNADTPKSVPFTWSFADLHATSWDSAQTTGALGYMPYDEVKRYTAIYDLQRDFHLAQQRGLDASLDVEGFETLLGRQDHSLAPADLSAAEHALGVAKANVGALKELSASLQRLYDEALR